jgi:2-methylisocitrate lyase-like PEP mutase family enzyme
MSTTTDKRRAFRQLHATGCFVMPNPWDVGSARWLQGMGFKALATTSAGAAFAAGHPDNGLSCDEMLAHIRALADATDVPLNADFGAGYADGVAGVQANVRRCIDTGVAGLSIEDATGDDAKPFYDLGAATERLRAARMAIDASGADVVLTGRAEGPVDGRLDDVCARIRAYAAAGADCLYAPGATTREHIAAVVEAAAGKPVNLLVGSPTTLDVRSIEALGVRRISVGSGLARVAWGAVIDAAERIAREGRFDGFAGAASGARLNRFFSEDVRRRTAGGGA